MHDRLEKFFKVGLAWLKDNCHYDPNDVMHRTGAFIFFLSLQFDITDLCCMTNIYTANFDISNIFSQIAVVLKKLRI